MHTAVIDNRQRHHLLHHVKQFCAHTRAQYCQVCALRLVLRHKRRTECRLVKLRSLICAVCLGECFELCDRARAAARIAAVQHIYHVQEIHLSRCLKNIIYAANRVAAVDEHQLFDLPCHDRFKQSFAKAAQIRMCNLICLFKALRHMIDVVTHTAERLQQLNRGIFADVKRLIHVLHLPAFQERLPSASRSVLRRRGCGHSRHRPR